MNDPSPPPLTDDDLSAALDGESSDAVARAIAASPEAQARQAVLGAAAVRVGAARIDPLPPETVDDLVARAIDTPLAPARPARAAAGPPRWMVAAAVIVLLVAGLALVFTGRDDDATDLATSAPVAEELAGDEDAASGDATAGSDLGADGEGFANNSTATDDAGRAEEGAAAPESTFGDLTPSDLPPLGRFPDGDALRASLADGFPTGAGTAIADQDPPSAEAVERCADQIQVVLDLPDPPARQGWSVVDDAATVVFEFPDTDLTSEGTTTDADASTLVAGLDVASCQPVTLFVR